MKIIGRELAYLVSSQSVSYRNNHSCVNVFAFEINIELNKILNKLFHRILFQFNIIFN